MRKIISIFLSLLTLTGVLTACGTTKTEPSDKLSIVTTIFPEYDWVNNILGSNADSANVTMLLDNGVDLHNYQPTAEDMIKISSCDLFIYVGGESDEWVNDALKEASNKNMKVLNLLDILGDAAKEEELIEGMESHESESDEHEAHDHEDEAEYDEHIWLSIKNAKILVSAIADALIEIDTENKDLYNANETAYIEKLTALDKKYQETVDGSNNKTLLFGDRFPFRYLTDDYGLSYYAAFVGCSAETEASFDTIAFLADKVNEHNLSTILTIDGTNNKIAETIASNTTSKDQQILSLNSMQSTTTNDAKDGATYLSIMEQNLETLKTALN